MSEFTARRSPVVAGQFYPSDPVRLQCEVDQYLSLQPAPAFPARVRALIVPHAGYPFSGATAGKAYALLKGTAQFHRVLVLAPAHRTYLRGASLGDYGSFATPLGDIEVDVEACRALVQESDLCSHQMQAQETEHALEVQLPFLQTVLPHAKLVPLVCGHMNRADIRHLAQVLYAQLWRNDTLWVVSTDFTHFGRSFGYMPFTKDVPKRLEELDRGAIDRILDFDCSGFFSYVEETGATICGHIPMAVLLAALEPAKQGLRATLLEYTTSGKLTHDYEHSVSYAAIAVGEHCDEAEDTCSEGADAEGRLSELDMRTLLTLARNTVEACAHGEPLPNPQTDGWSRALIEPAACFVTLHMAGELRGCIGNLEPLEPLYLNVIHNARNAACNDSRFRPLSADELPRIDIEISVLTPSVPIETLEQFVIGRHGIILEKGRHRAVFLPQVAPEYGWDRETTLRHLSRKAGLEADAWRRDTKFSVFEAIVFGDMPQE